MSHNTNRSIPLKRRDFLRGLGAAGAYASAALLAGCRHREIEWAVLSAAVDAIAVHVARRQRSRCTTL
jgi:hypothetical protein